MPLPKPLTLERAIETGRINTFLAQQEARRIGPATRKKHEAAIAAAQNDQRVEQE